MSEEACGTIDFFMAGSRAGVLVIASIAAVLCIYLGWRLYKDAVISNTKGEFAGAGIKVRLTAASPGIFLVAFGIWLLITLVNRTAEWEDVTAATRSSAHPTQHHVSQTAVKEIVRTTYLAEAAPESQGKPAATDRDCVLRRISKKFMGGGSALDKAQVHDAMGKSIAAIQRAGDRGVTDVKERVALISTLRNIQEMASD